MEIKTRMDFTQFHKKEMVQYIESNPREFDNLLKMIFSDRKPFNWRAAWLTHNCMEVNDKRASEYIPKLIKKLPLLPLTSGKISIV
ncbi:MAG: hypothetical protein R2771_06120 [Saprospiraceae bacterium]